MCSHPRTGGARSSTRATRWSFRHDIEVHGPDHVVEMTLRVRVRYDSEGKAASISLEPDDLGLFDHVLNTVLRNSQAS